MRKEKEKNPIQRCSLYTRKSSDEGLDQAFNSLDAQREACAAFVKSQKPEGWIAIPNHYDDGGYSGGSMERPALQRLLADIKAGRVDIVIVYKIDRLTRSLADFARMVELFEKHRVSFVSVTQAFNTTSSMGRLTLNVLLSFAQFEREVTGERIRDKIAASKAKGMWMGGTLPFGYDLPLPGTRALIVNEGEAATVRMIFETYLELGSVHALERQLRDQGIRSKVRQTAKGQKRGGVFFSRGALFHLLRNRLYRGEINHKGRSHPGLHLEIVDAELFDAVQAKLDEQTRRNGSNEGGVARSALTGRIFDADGAPMSPTFAYGKNRRLYRYYVSASLQQGGKPTKDDLHPRRIAASALEEHLAAKLGQVYLPDAALVDAGVVLGRIQRLVVERERLIVTLHKGTDELRQSRAVSDREDIAIDLSPVDPSCTRLVLPYRFSTARGRTEIVAGDQNGLRRDPILIRAIRRAHAMLDRGGDGAPWLDASPDRPRQRRLIRLAFLAPDIQRDILAGHQPPRMTLAALLDSDIPLGWSEQRALYQRHS